MGIPLDPEFGVNPSMAVCFWCGEARGDILLLGRNSRRITGQAEAPRYLLTDYDPCDDCKKLMAQGIAFIVVTDKPGKDGLQLPIKAVGGGNVYPTGRWHVVTKEGAMRFWQTTDFKKDPLPDKIFVTEDLADKIGLRFPKGEENGIDSGSEG